MTIPGFGKSHVLAALKKIDSAGIPPGRLSTKYSLHHKGRSYPPKYVVSLAVEDATGRAFAPQQFSGGAQTNDVLVRSGFEVAGPKGKIKAPEATGSQKAKPQARTASRANAHKRLSLPKTKSAVKPV